MGAENLFTILPISISSDFENENFENETNL